MFKRFLSAILVLMLLAAVPAGCSSEPKKIENDQLPASAMEFLRKFTDWYQGESFDSKTASDCALMTSLINQGDMIDWTQYDVQPVEHWADGTTDPKNWCEITGGCYIEMDKKTVDGVLRDVYNLSDEQIAEQIKQGEAMELFYLDGDKYYAVIGGIGDPLTAYKPFEVLYDGKNYTVQYDCWFDFGQEEMEYAATYKAVITQKKDGGREYWSLISMERLDAAG